MNSIRGVAQPGSALRSGRRGRRFESYHPDSLIESNGILEFDNCYLRFEFLILQNSIIPVVIFDNNKY